MDLTKLLNWEYLFHPYPIGFSWPMRLGLLIIFIAMIAWAIYSRQRMNKSHHLRRKVWQKFESWGWTSGLIGLTLIYFREVRAIYLSSRGWLLIWLILSLIWLVFIIKYLKTKVPAKESLAKQKEEFNKWLPRQK